jgi:simple sugar transport system substrate-binding protein
MISMALKRLGYLAAFAVTVAAGAANAADVNIGFVYVSPIGDAGYTYQHDLGRKAIEAEFGDKVKTTFVESVPEGADAERVIRELAASGNQLIFTTSFGYMNPTIKVAKQFPDVHFEHATGYKQADNVATYKPRFYEGRYLTGIVAGKVTKSNIIGYVGAFPIPEVVRGIDAFTLGLRSVNPEAEVKVIWVSSWYDPGKEREAVETLIAQGADIITQHTDSTAPVQTAQDKGVHAIGYHSDMSKYGPKAHLTAATHVWDQYYIARVKAHMDGTWKSTDTWGGMADGMMTIAPFGPDVPEDVQKLVKEKQAEITGGKLHPFAGPIKDNEGNVKVAEGATMSDEEMLGMNWYVEGVQGKVPQ